MRRIGTVAAVVMGLVLIGPTAMADGEGDWDGHNSNNGTVIDGALGGGHEEPGGYDPANGPYVPSGPPPPAYKDYWTPACSVNGPPGTGFGDVMCMGAATICDTRGQKDAIYMRHYRQQVSPTVGDWEYVGSVCRGPNEPVEEEPQVTTELVLDQAYAAAPRPTAAVQPGTRSYVNLPNNYWADAPGETVTVNVLGNPIAITFTVNDVTWDFGDGSSASGEGVQDAEVGAPGAVEHAYGQQGSYDITATSTVGVQFTLPNGQTINQPGAFQFSSEPVTLPVGEIQTRVDSTG